MNPTINYDKIPDLALAMAQTEPLRLADDLPVICIEVEVHQTQAEQEWHVLSTIEVLAPAVSLIHHDTLTFQWSSLSAKYRW